jgi:hypothetical protein
MSSTKSLILYLMQFFLTALVIKSTALCMLGKRFATELPHSTLAMFSKLLKFGLAKSCVWG